MRGKVYQPYEKAAVVGITPAYAGKSCGVSKAAAERRDHPRLCGEKFPSPSPPTYAEGSPPPMRGKVSNDGLFPNKQRITPAYAGKRNAMMA